MLSPKYDWKLKTNNTNKDQVNELSKQLGLDPLVVSLLIARGYSDPEAIKHFLAPDESDLNDPFLLPGMEKAVSRIQQAVASQEQITIYGDYDADGLTSTAIMYETLLELGAKVNYFIPNRFKDGYGPNSEEYKRIINEGTSLIVTVDNGVSGFEQVELANQMNCDVVITDHHELPKKLPNAYAIVHANLKGSKYPFSYLSGAGIAFKVASALTDEIPQDKMDLAAIGTVADLVSLTGENRALVQFGLNVIHLTQRPGLKWLIKKSKLHLDKIDEEDIGYKIAPQLNALGRMGDASVGVELLTTMDEAAAKKLAKLTETKNEERKRQVAEVSQQAEVIAQKPENLQRKALLIVGHDWPTGILGIVASRLTDKFHKPSVVVSLDSQTNEATGSGRSLPGFDLFKALEPQKDLMSSFGGHEMAVGLTIPKENLEKVAVGFENAKETRQLNLNKKGELPLSLKVSVDEITDKLYQQLQQLSPFGTDNEKPELLVTPNRITHVAAIGASHDHLKFQLDGVHNEIGAIDFGMGDKRDEVRELADNLQAAGTLNLNEWRGRTSLQLMTDDLRVDGLAVVDKRTKRLSKSMFKRPGKYLFFDEKLLNQVQGFFGNGAEPELAADASDSASDSVVYLVDFPASYEELEKTLKQLNCREIITYFYKKRINKAYGMPSRSQYATLFKFVRGHKDVSVKTSLAKLSQYLKIPKNLLVFMIQSFNELGFVTIKNGIMNGVKNPNQHRLSEAPCFKDRETSISLEQKILDVTSTQLGQLIRKLYN